MTTRKPSRTEWHQKQGKWMRTLGTRGCRIRLFQKRKGGSFYRAVYLPQRGQHDKQCLFTADRCEAERLGRECLAAALSQSEVFPAPVDVTLGDLCARFRAENPDFLDNTPQTQRTDRARMDRLLSVFGKNCKVVSLQGRDITEYTARRRAGGLIVTTGDKTVVTRPVRMRSVEGDLALLYRMLRWATTVRLPNGKRWLEYHPLEAVRRNREKNPKRPVATWDRFQTVRVQIQKTVAEATVKNADATRIRWLKVELALVLVEATGRRIGSVRQLRWEDVDLAGAVIHWRAEADKKGKDWVVPIPATLVEELRTFQRRLGSVGGWIFAAEKNPAVPMDRYLLDHWLVEAETAAEVSKLDGGLWHPYRRKWATERKALPLKDVAAAGGWKDVQTLLTCYQQADPDTILAVMSEPTKLRDRQAVG